MIHEHRLRIIIQCISGTISNKKRKKNEKYVFNEVEKKGKR